MHRKSVYFCDFENVENNFELIRFKKTKSLGRHVSHFEAGQWRIECQQVFKEGHYGKKK